MFESAVSKVERANKHIRDLNDVLHAFRNTDLHILSVELNPKTGKSFLRVTTPRLPDPVPFILGDAIHNLRAALDHVWWDAHNWVGAKTYDWTKIPFGTTREKVIGTIKKAPIKTLGADEIIDVLMNFIRPHYDSGPDNPFVALQNLDVTDKHCLLIPVLADIVVAGVSLEDSKGKWTDHDITLKITTPGGSYVVGPDTYGTLEIKNKGRATFDVVFGHDQPLRGQSVIPALHNLSNAVSGAIEQFQDAAVRFFRRTRHGVAHQR